MTTLEPVVEINRVNFSFSGKNILRNVNLTINQLDSTCVVGPNGGGKSTLIKIITGVYQPDEGESGRFLEGLVEPRKPTLIRGGGSRARGKRGRTNRGRF